MEQPTIKAELKATFGASKGLGWCLSADSPEVSCKGLRQHPRTCGQQHQSRVKHSVSEHRLRQESAQTQHCTHFPPLRFQTASAIAAIAVSGSSPQLFSSACAESFSQACCG